MTSSRKFLRVTFPVSSLVLFAVFAVTLLSGSTCYAKSSTTTTLQVTSTCIAEGCVTTLTATVLAGSTAVHPGLVTFCDGAVAQCEYGLPVGQGQTIANGTATIKRTLAPGVHHLHAVFSGTSTYGGSVSASQDLTIAAIPNPATMTTIGATGTAFDYTLSGIVQGLGTVAPSGTVSFLDTTKGNSVVGSGMLVPQAGSFGYVAGQLDLSQISSVALFLATAAAAGDFNGDGFADIVTVSPSGVVVLLGDGRGKFTQAPSTTNAVGTQAMQVVVADFNSDGKLDIAVPDSSTGKIYVSLGNGDGTFRDAKPIVLAAGTLKLFVGDFNNDGFPDLLVSSQTTANNVASYAIEPVLSKGDGTCSTTSAPIDGYRAGAVGDFDQDGNLDIAVVAGAVINNMQILVLHGNGDGSFTPLTKTSGTVGGDLFVGDFNGDGIPDLVTYDGFVYVYQQGKGDGTFIEGSINDYPASYSSVVVGDFNGDGTLDLGIVGASVYTPSFYQLNVFYGSKLAGNGFEFPGGGTSATMPNISAALVSADFTSDGVPDLVAFSARGPAAPTVTQLNYVGAYTSASVASSSNVTLQGAGGHDVIASYSGDSGHNASVSSPTALFGVQGTDYTTGFTDTSKLTLNGGATLQGSAIRLVDGQQFESRSFFYSKRLPVYIFQSTFDFQITNPNADGFAFVVQSNGPNALGSSGAAVGYGLPPGATAGASILNSVALVFDLHNNQGERSNSIRVETGGITTGTGAIDLTKVGLDLHSGHKFQAQINGYTSSQFPGNLLVTLTDLQTKATFSYPFTVELVSQIGDSIGYVGFTAGTGVNTSTVDILNWSFSGQGCCGLATTNLISTIPEFGGGFGTGSNLLQLNGKAAITNNALQLTDGGTFEASSVYFKPQIHALLWSTDFDFTISGSGGDGFTFVLQSEGLTALGAPGGGLGYGPDSPTVKGERIISPSAAFKFDVHNNDGEGTDSTGMYVNGASPTVPSVDLSTSRIHLANGHIFHARLVDGRTLWITDLTSYAVVHVEFPYSPINFPSYSNYMGFTAGTGATANTVKILNWDWNYPSDNIY